jgi:hypothetical protein
MSRKQSLHTGIAVLREPDRLPPAFAPRCVNCSTRFEFDLAGIGTQFAAEKSVLIEAARQHLLEVGHLPEAPPIVVLLRQPAHSQQHVHRADIAFRTQDLSSGRSHLFGEFNAIHSTKVQGGWVGSMMCG